MKVFQKGIATRISDEFSSKDFDCHCSRPECVETYIDESLVAGLEKLAIVFPILTINSGFRCRVHNAKVGGSENSMHCLGRAADIQSPFGGGKELSIAAQIIPQFKNGGIGVAKNFVHLDVRGVAARWVYPIIRTQTK